MPRRKRGLIEVAYQPCQHLVQFKAKHGAPGFLRILQHFTPAAPSSMLMMKKEEHEEVLCCSACGISHGRLYACLVCASVGCWMDPGTSHASRHAQTEPGHEIAMDVERSELFCCICGDQVYDLEFDRAVIDIASTANGSINDSTSQGATAAGSSALPYTGKKRWKAESIPRIPTIRVQSLRRRRSILLNEKSRLPWGLRGLNNLGNTCFMNSVLQALLHTPPLRNFFLSGGHNCRNCPTGNNSHHCLACDLNAMFDAAFSGDRTPHSPAQFLLSWWQHAAELAEHAQQDAHEFFISVLDGIHSNPVELQPLRRRSGVLGECDCIVHQVFLGILRSDVTCRVCGSSSTTIDPFIDISLDLEPSSHPNKDGLDLRKSNPGHVTVCRSQRTTRGLQASSGSTKVSTLYGCLDCFTRPERLGPCQKLFCQTCNAQQESVKQMSFGRLPFVLCLHIKRFEHLLSQRKFSKIDQYLQFPFVLDMTPYLSSSVLRTRNGNRLVFSGEDDSGMPTSSTEFDLFAVVTHFGTLDSGHYVAYLSLDGLWYRCNDSWIMQVDEDVVRASQAYMLFYVKKASLPNKQ